MQRLRLGRQLFSGNQVFGNWIPPLRYNPSRCRMWLFHVTVYALPCLPSATPRFIHPFNGKRTLSVIRVIYRSCPFLFASHSVSDLSLGLCSCLSPDSFKGIIHGSHIWWRLEFLSPTTAYQVGQEKCQRNFTPDSLVWSELLSSYHKRHSLVFLTSWGS